MKDFSELLDAIRCQWRSSQPSHLIGLLQMSLLIVGKHTQVLTPIEVRINGHTQAIIRTADKNKLAPQFPLLLQRMQGIPLQSTEKFQ